MAKAITFGRVFPKHHPKEGQETFFVEAILTQLDINYKSLNYYEWLIENNPQISEAFLDKFFVDLKINVAPKSHTIRDHKKPLKVGEFINPKCWAGKPYNKTKEGFWQIKFAPDIEIKKTWQFDMALSGVYSIDGKKVYEDKEHILALNDGLNVVDMQYWFMPNYSRPKEFKGQINCWNETINY